MATATVTDRKLDISFFELQTAIADATAGYLARRRPDLPDLAWLLRDDLPNRRLIGKSYEDGPEGVAESLAWAQVLGLPEKTDEHPGARGWSGSVRTRDVELHVFIWCVVDRDRWEAGR